MDGAFTYILYRGLDGSSDPGIPGGMHVDMLDARLSLALSLSFTRMEYGGIRCYQRTR